MESWLKKFGFDPQIEADRLNLIPPSERKNYFKNELASHEIHVIRNHAVSLPFNYWLSDEEKIFTNKEYTIELELAGEERGGYYRIGIPKALKLAKDNPNKLVYYYSPIGPASFDDPPHPDYEEPYNDGQLNLIYSDGEKIKNINVPLDKQGEQQWLGEIFDKDDLSYINDGQDEKERIVRFITSPVLSTLTIDDFLNHNWQNPELVIFHSNSLDKERFFTINDVMFELRNSLIGKLKAKINVELIAQQAIQNGGSHVRPEDITKAYFTLMKLVMKQEGVRQLVLGGNCGGSTVNSDMIGLDNPVDELLKKSNLSSSYRRQTQTKENGESFSCPSCEKPIPKGKGITVCPHCGISKDEYAKKTNQKICD